MTQDKAPAAPKMALCIRRHYAPERIALAKGTAAAFEPRPGFWHTPTELADRASCETDESLLQLIPYVAVIDTGDLFHYTPPRIFTYARGAAGEEARLHGALSIGLGGHIDTEPPAPDRSLKGHLASEACRELLEEVGLVASPAEIIHSGAFIYNPADAVGRVHLGALCAVAASSARFGEAESGVIENGLWLTLKQLTQPETYSRLEPWSQAAVRYFGERLWW